MELLDNINFDENKLLNSTLKELNRYFEQDFNTELSLLFEFKLLNNKIPLIYEIKLKEEIYNAIIENVKIKTLFNKLCNENNSLGYISISVLNDDYLYKARFLNNERKITKDVVGYFDVIFNGDYMLSLLQMIQFNMKQYNQFENIYKLYNEYYNDIKTTSLMIVTSEKQFEYDFINNDKMINLLSIMKDTIYEDKLYDIVIKINFKNGNSIELTKELGGFYKLNIIKNYQYKNIYYGLPKINRKTYETKFKESFEFCLK